MIKAGIGIFVILAALSGCVGKGQYDALLAKNEKLQEENDALKGRLDSQGEESEKLSDALREYKERAELMEQLKRRFENLREKLNKLTDLGLQISIRKNRMVISLPGDVLFSSGKDELSEKGTAILGEVADVIRSDADLASRHYQVAGHTDSARLKNEETIEKFHDNWGLSLMRARRVLLFLISKPTKEEGGGGLNPKKWSASGYGPMDPVATNGSPRGRQKNRRVELILMPNVEEMLDLKSLIDKTSVEETDEDS